MAVSLGRWNCPREGGNLPGRVTMHSGRWWWRLWKRGTVPTRGKVELGRVTAYSGK